MHSQEEVKALARGSSKDRLEASFLAHWTTLFSKLPSPLRQHKFHTDRKWAFDFAWPEWKLAVELDGGSWIKGGHNTATGQARDYEKHNAAVRLGWRVLRFNTPMMKNMAEVVEYVAEVLTNAE